MSNYVPCSKFDEFWSIVRIILFVAAFGAGYWVGIYDCDIQSRVSQVEPSTGRYLEDGRFP